MKVIDGLEELHSRWLLLSEMPRAPYTTTTIEVWRRICTVSLTDPQGQKLSPQLDCLKILPSVFAHLWTQTSRSLLKKVTIQTFAKYGQ